MFNGNLNTNTIEFYQPSFGQQHISLSEDCKQVILLSLTTAASDTFLRLPINAYIGKTIKIIVQQGTLPSGKTASSAAQVHITTGGTGDVIYRLKNGFIEFTFIGELMLGAVSSGSASYIGGWMQSSLAGFSSSAELPVGVAGAIAIGHANNGVGLYAISIGNSVTASGQTSVALGSSSSATGLNSVVIGSTANSGADRGISIGDTAYSSGVGGISLGYRAGFVGSTAMCVRPSSVNGIVAASDNQITKYMLMCQTTNNTPTDMTSATTVAKSTTNLIGQWNQSSQTIIGTVLARESATGDSAMWEVKFLMKRGANASTTVLVGTPTVTKLFNDAGATTWTISINVDTTNGGAYIIATGETAKTIKWTSDLTGSFVTG